MVLKKVNLCFGSTRFSLRFVCTSGTNKFVCEISQLASSNSEILLDKPDAASPRKNLSSYTCLQAMWRIQVGSGLVVGLCTRIWLDIKGFHGPDGAT